MARPLRIEYPGAVYHVTSRGNVRADVFLSDGDRQRFLDILGDTVEKYNWLCHGFCLLDNHYHTIIETLDANLFLGMRQLNGFYTQAFNRSHGRVGHLFQGRYKAILIEKGSHLLELCRYVALNPVRAGMVEKPEDWTWSSDKITAFREGAGIFDRCLGAGAICRDKNRSPAAISRIRCRRIKEPPFSLAKTCRPGFPRQ